MRKFVGDLSPQHEGGTIIVQRPAYQGQFVSVRKTKDPAFVLLALLSPTGTPLTVILRPSTSVELIPLPKLEVGTHVLHSGFYREGTTQFRRFIEGQVISIGKDTMGRIVYQVQWSGALDATYYVRSRLIKLDAETRAAVLADLTESKGQNA